jgi:hypothetical protein
MHVSPVTVIASLALVFAMTGGAYAAKKYLITSTKQISPSVLKALQGKAGAAGAQGAAGAVGPAGAQGPQGPAGPRGETGSAGKDGAAGAKGATGPAGQTGFTETLPKEKTEMGDWSITGNAAGTGEFFANSVSFNIPLGAVPVVHYITSKGLEPIITGNHEIEEVKSTRCLGSAAAPSAEPGNLCVYASIENDSLDSSEAEVVIPAICPFGRTKGDGSLECLTGVESGVHSADRSGFGIVGASKGAGAVQIWGTWAVTAPE